MYPYYNYNNCPYISQGIDSMYYIDRAQQPMQPFQPMMPMPMLEMPMSPLFQPPGIHIPPGFDTMQSMPGMDLMGSMPGLSEMGDAGPATVSPGDPPPILSDNPARVTIALFKELTGYPNYGNPSGNADILYTGNRGSWTFNIPAFLFLTGNLTAQLVIRAVLDDHSNVPVNRYSARITFNGVQVHTGRLPLEHGTPVGQRFINWRLLTFNVTNIRRINTVTIVNTSTAGADDWIGLDWMELRLSPR